VTFDAMVEVTLRRGIADPQGSTIERALPGLGYDGISRMHVGKAFRFSVDAPDEAAARGVVEELAKRFLSNPVLEDSAITITTSTK